MRRRHILPAAALSGALVLGALAMLLPGALVPTAVERAGAESEPTLAKAPLSLGNPFAAATLQLRRWLEPADAPPAAAAAPSLIFTQTLVAGNGDTLAGLLLKAGVARDDAHNAIAALKGYYNPRAIRPGHEIVVSFRVEGTEPETNVFAGFSLAPDFRKRVVVSRSDGGFVAEEVQAALSRDLARAAGTIARSLYVDGRRAEVPAPVLTEMIRAFSWDVDFQRDVKPGDAFAVVYEAVYDERDALVHNGNIALASLTLSGATKVLYRHTTGDGHTDYFDRNGQSVRKALLRTPIDGARLSSSYGKRTHPILGFTLMHRGVDFAAPTGTPIYAAGDGTIAIAGLNGAYGNYVQIRHNERYATAYAHLSRFGAGVRQGRRVRQGEIIGYVGTTGRSTGPHLHYEVLVGGQQTNPMSVKLPAGRKLEGRELARFQEARADLERRVAVLADEGVAVAAGESDAPRTH
jgi:murein DD-endopeptidase MepM/ murein hydrolase activator NlpD